MGVDTAAEGLRVIAALQQRDETAAAAFVGDVHQPFGHVAEIHFHEPQTAERIGHMRVKAGGNQNQVGPEIAQARQNAMQFAS